MTAISCKAVLLDIEGTTTSISFVKDVLFPYVRNHVSEYLDNHWGEEELMSVIQDLKEQAEMDIQNGMTDVAQIPPLDTPKDDLHKAVVANVLTQMDGDRKTPSLKKLQGYMWRNAYYSQEILGHVYEDVSQALRLWKQKGLDIFIYSSGSVEAQKLLFQHSVYGNMLYLIAVHFDTSIGPKVEAESYKRIADRVSLKPEDMLFLTDVAKEAKAARAAGFQVGIVVREGNAPLHEEDKKQYWQISTFDEVTFC